MAIELSDKEMIYLYGNLKKHLTKLESVKPKSLVKADIQFHKSIISQLEAAMPQLKSLPL